MMNEEALERLALQHAMQRWKSNNMTLFGRSLRPVGFQLHDGRSRLGFWDRRHRLISLSRDLVFSEPWIKVEAVLRHEMLHQFLDESMGATDVPPHGELFRHTQKQLGIEDYEEVGLGSLDSEGDVPQHKVLEKVKKLLSLAQSDVLHEAENAMAKANALMLKWNIDQKQLKEDRQVEVRHLGQPGKAFLYLKMLSCLLRDYFFVEVIWVKGYHARTGKSGNVIEVMGRPENVEMAHYVYDFLLNTGELHWKAYRLQAPKSNRMTYLYGLMAGFYEKCKRGREQEEQRSQALVWKGESWLGEYLSRRHPRVRSMASSKAKLDGDSYRAGLEKGESIVLRKGVNKNSDRKKLASGQRALLDK